MVLRNICEQQQPNRNNVMYLSRKEGVPNAEIRDYMAIYAGVECFLWLGIKIQFLQSEE